MAQAFRRGRDGVPEPVTLLIALAAFIDAVAAVNITHDRTTAEGGLLPVHYRSFEGDESTFYQPPEGVRYRPGCLLQLPTLSIEETRRYGEMAELAVSDALVEELASAHVSGEHFAHVCGVVIEADARRDVAMRMAASAEAAGHVTPHVCRALTLALAASVDDAWHTGLTATLTACPEAFAVAVLSREMHLPVFSVQDLCASAERITAAHMLITGYWGPFGGGLPRSPGVGEPQVLPPELLPMAWQKVDFEMSHRAFLHLAQVVRQLEVGQLPARLVLGTRTDQAFAGRSQLELPSTASALSRPRVGLQIAASRAHKHLVEYARTVDLWRCYSHRHGYQLVLDVDDVELDAGSQTRGPGGVSFYFQKWIAAKRNLPHYDVLILVDTDMWVNLDCWSRPLHELMPARKHIAVRDRRWPQTLNTALVMLRNSPVSQLFIDLVLDKQHWFGLASADQSSVDEALLEFLSLEKDPLRGRQDLSFEAETLAPVRRDRAGAAPHSWAARRNQTQVPGATAAGSRVPLDWDFSMVDMIIGNGEAPAAVAELGHRGDYSSECLAHILPALHGMPNFAQYTLCWHQWADRLVGGPLGSEARKLPGSALELIDPTVTDVNHVVGVRGIEPALVYHYAGRDRFGKLEMWKHLGLTAEECASCPYMLAMTARREAENGCLAGSSPVENPLTYCPGDPPLAIC